MALTEKEIKEYVKELKNKKDVKVYAPYKYFKGLKTKKDVRSRFNDIASKKDYTKTSSYKQFSTDKNKKTKESKYTKQFFDLYGRDAKSIRAKAEASGAPYHILKKVYDKGAAAWVSGHRVGASPQQWGYARIHSFLTLGCTALSADFYLFEDMVDEMLETKKGTDDLRVILSNKISCEKSKLNSKYYKRYNAVPYIKQIRRML